MIETTGYIRPKTGGFFAVCMDCRKDRARVKAFSSEITRDQWIDGHSKLHGHKEFAIETAYGSNSWEIRTV